MRGERGLQWRPPKLPGSQALPPGAGSEGLGRGFGLGRGRGVARGWGVESTGASAPVAAAPVVGLPLGAEFAAPASAAAGVSPSGGLGWSAFAVSSVG